MAKNFGDEAKPRAWSKYASDSSAHKKMTEKKKDAEKKNKKEKTSKATAREEKLGKLLGDVSGPAKVSRCPVS